MKLEALPWVILFLPLLAAATITLFTLRDRNVSARLSIGAVLTAFALTLLFIGVNGWGSAETRVSWLAVGDLHVDFGLKLDSLSLLMLLVVTGVGGAIHVYSAGYMRDDAGWSRYFACLSLFTFSMLGIVLANNFVQLFISWELVGVSSYLLIGFWFDRPSAADAAKKAFITNRLGDFGFLLGILTVWVTLGSLDFTSLQAQLAAKPAALGGIASLAGLLIFCGAVGKSAQFPLHVWLPDAMEGPTPVSALIHAATMVAAGVYMLCRIIFLLDPTALEVIGWVGGFTALLAAIIAIQQDDIKRILAYSTLSQLGYMVMAVGLAGPTPAMFHLTTHAFFKALLFLGAGSVILALHHEQDIWKMGGLRRRMPVTFWTFLFGTLALCGVPPFSGFYSKDGIFAQALQRTREQPITGWALFALAVLVAVLTAFYMFRLFYVAFLGAPRSPASEQARESPAVMAWPLRGLAVFSLVGGVIGVSRILNLHFLNQGFPGLVAPAAAAAAPGTAPGNLLLVDSAAGTVAAIPPGVYSAVASNESLLQKILEPLHSPVAVIAGLVAVLAGFLAARALYRHATRDPLPARLGALARAMRNRFYFDELYEGTVIRAHDGIAAVADWIDRWLIAGLCVRGMQGTTELAGRALRLVQTGNLQTYAFLFVFGVAVLLWLVIGK